MSKWVHSTHSPAWSISAQAVAVETSSRLTTPTSPVEAQGESSTNSPMAAMATCSVSSGSESEMSVSDCAANVEELADSEALTPAGKGKGKGPTKGKGPAKGKGKRQEPTGASIGGGAPSTRGNSNATQCNLEKSRWVKVGPMPSILVTGNLFRAGPDMWVVAHLEGWKMKLMIYIYSSIFTQGFPYEYGFSLCNGSGSCMNNTFLTTITRWKLQGVAAVVFK